MSFFIMTRFYLLLVLGISFLAVTVFAVRPETARAQERTALTPLQREIEKQRALLASPDIETRRDALIRLGTLGRAESSRVAVAGLNDPVPMIRATAAHAVLSLPADDIGVALVPLLNDKSEFVRQQVAYALGEAKSNRAVQALVASLAGDKADSVRGAAAVALGQIGDQAAVFALAAIIDRSLAPSIAGKKKSVRKKENEFVARAAARALGQIRSSQAVPALAKAIEDESSADDLRREAAVALGLIGDPSAEPALRAVLGAQDPHLSRIAREALSRIERNAKKQGM